jgi:hypothetical protein
MSHTTPMKWSPMIKKKPEDLPVTRKDAAVVATLAATEAVEPALHVARWAFILAVAALCVGTYGACH